jgi:hypothetical protein
MCFCKRCCVITDILLYGSRTNHPPHTITVKHRDGLATRSGVHARPLRLPVDQSLHPPRREGRSLEAVTSTALWLNEGSSQSVGRDDEEEEEEPEEEEMRAGRQGGSKEGAHPSPAASVLQASYHFGAGLSSQSVYPYDSISAREHAVHINTETTRTIYYSHILTTPNAPHEEGPLESETHYKVPLSHKGDALIKIDSQIHRG